MDEINETQMEPEKKKTKLGLGILIGLVIGLVVGAAALLAFFLFTGRALTSADPTKVTSIAPEAVKEEAETAGESAVDSGVIRKMQLIEEIFNRYYLEEDIDKSGLPDDIYTAMVESMGDKYSAYYSAEDYKKATEERQGLYYGIGAYVSMNTDIGYAVISSVMDDSPALEAGVRADDIIYEIEGESAYGLELDEIVRRIKGEEGTFVNIKFIRNESEEVELRIERRQIKSTTVKYKMLDDNIGYLQLTAFETVSEDQFREAKADLEAQGMQGLILDLRGNPGGNLTTVVAIARELLPEGLIIKTEDRNGKGDSYYSDGKKQFKLPMVVLVNEYSASASEVLTGALQDYEMATIVGTTTYGKGIVQETITLTDGSAVKLTTEAYYTPKGRNLHGVGIDPDVEIEFDSDTYYETEGEYDNQLEKAIEVIKEKIK